MVELEQIQHDMALKEVAQEVRQVEERSDEAKNRLVSSAAATGIEGRYRKEQSLKLTKMRSDAIFNAARAYATQAGLAWRYDQTNALLLGKYEGALDQATSFRPFIEQGVILIPSVLESRNDRALADGVLTELSASFYIDEEAAIVMEPPTFRDYLIRYYPEPEELHPALLPANDQEQVLWDKGADEGWQLGVTQAEDIFTDGFNEMEKDIIGRITYLKLKSLNMIGDATLQQTAAGVTFNGRAMNVGEVIYQITDQAQYQTLSGWRSAWSIPSEEDSSSE